MKHYKKILLATDFSKASETAAERAADVAFKNDAEVTLVHIVTYVPPNYVGVELPAKYASKDFLLERAETHLQEWAEPLGFAKSARVVKAGTAKREIIATAKELGVDLMVIGAHGETGIPALFGSVANSVVQAAECDVLVVRPEN